MISLYLLRLRVLVLDCVLEYFIDGLEDYLVNLP